MGVGRRRAYRKLGSSRLRASSSLGQVLFPLTSLQWAPRKAGVFVGSCKRKMFSELGAPSAAEHTGQFDSGANDLTGQDGRRWRDIDKRPRQAAELCCAIPLPKNQSQRPFPSPPPVAQTVMGTELTLIPVLFNEGPHTLLWDQHLNQGPKWVHF